MHWSASQTDVWSSSYDLLLVKQRTDDRTDGRMDGGRTAGRKVGRAVGRTDGWTHALPQSANVFSQIKNRFFIWLRGGRFDPLPAK